MARSDGDRMVQTLVRLLGDMMKALLRSSSSASSRPKTGPAAGRTPARAGGARSGYAGDATDVPELQYAPFDDDRADPGEIVWAWVPYEEDHSHGKDRPVLVVGRRGGLLLALMLTSKDHDRDAADEARHGRYWIDIGTGVWDRQGRPSEVRVDRVLQLDPSAVRREGATLDRERFDQVAAEVRRRHRAA
jgi:hypothetical protein